jgi:hypothetical protein
MKRDLRLGSSARSMATRWRQLARGPKITRLAIGKTEVVRPLFEGQRLPP